MTLSPYAKTSTYPQASKISPHALYPPGERVEKT